MRRLFPLALVLLAGALRPASACCQLGGTACGDPTAVDCNNGSVCFVPYRTCPGCTCTTTNEGKTCLATASEPGTVGPLQIDKVPAGSALVLSWGAGCFASGPDYSVHEGTLGVWYSNEPLRCTSASALTLTITPSGGDRYYLIAPEVGDFTGSLGTNSAGAQRPLGLASCTPDRALVPCP
jgi:hypothetical protein